MANIPRVATFHQFLRDVMRVKLMTTAASGTYGPYKVTVRDGRANMDCPILPGRDQDLPLTASHVLWVY